MKRLQQSTSQLGAEGVLGCCAGLGLEAGRSEGTGVCRGEVQNCLEQRRDEAQGERERRAWITL